SLGLCPGDRRHYSPRDRGPGEPGDRLASFTAWEESRFRAEYGDPALGKEAVPNGPRLGGDQRGGKRLLPPRLRHEQYPLRMPPARRADVPEPPIRDAR